MRNRNLLIIFMASGLSLAGCKFGNYSQNPTIVSINGVQKIETYPAEAKALQTLVVYKDSQGNYTTNENDNAPLSAVPLSALSTFTPVVQLFIMADPSLTPVFASMYADPFNPGTVIPAGYDSKGNFTLTSRQISGYGFGPDPNCATGVFISETGTLHQNQPTVVTLSGQQVTTSGTLSMNIVFEQLFTDGCATYLQRLATCYQNGAGCSAAELSDAQLFQLYATQTNIVDLSKASTIKELAYSILFQ